MKTLSMASGVMVSGLDRLVEAVEATEAAAAARRLPRQVDGGFECPHPGCARVFSKRYNQQAHMRLHDGTRPFNCGLCGKAFMWKSSLKSHAKMHAKMLSGGGKGGVTKRRESITASKSGSSGMHKKDEGKTRVGVSLQLPTLTKGVPGKHGAGPLSPDCVSRVDHDAATVLTTFR